MYYTLIVPVERLSISNEDNLVRIVDLTDTILQIVLF
jgi:hypothetical protein